MIALRKSYTRRGQFLISPSSGPTTAALTHIVWQTSRSYVLIAPFQPFPGLYTPPCSLPAREHQRGWWITDMKSRRKHTNTSPVRTQRDLIMQRFAFCSSPGRKAFRPLSARRFIFFSFYLRIIRTWVALGREKRSLINHNVASNGQIYCPCQI